MPSKMSPEENTFLYWLARSYYSGRGVIVDAGVLLGASTMAFGMGLRDGLKLKAMPARFGAPIKSFELGIIHKNMMNFFVKHNVAMAAAPGESFEPALREFIQPVADLVDLRIGDIMKTGGEIEHPVEILFLDVLKTEAINNFALMEYFPRLIPEVSIVIQQDYFFEELWFVKLAQEYFADRFEYQGEVGSSAIFRSIRAISKEEIASFIATPPSGEEQLRLVGNAMHHSLDPDRRFMCALSKVVLIARLQGVDKAKDYLEHIRSDYPEQAARGNRRLTRAFKHTAELAQKTHDSLLRVKKEKADEPISGK